MALLVIVLQTVSLRHLLRRQEFEGLTIPGCGSQADTAIIRDRDMGSGRATALGRTQGNGPIDAAAVISTFMGTGANSAPTNNGTDGASGVEDDLSELQAASAQRRAEHKRQIGNLFGGGNGGGSRLGGLFGGGGNGGGSGIGGLFGGGGNANDRGPETMVADTAGLGGSNGLPTASDSGEINMVFRQVRFHSHGFHIQTRLLTRCRSTRMALAH
jgi:hypothetical protein